MEDLITELVESDTVPPARALDAKLFNLLFCGEAGCEVADTTSKEGPSRWVVRSGEDLGWEVAGAPEAGASKPILREVPRYTSSVEDALLLKHVLIGFEETLQIEEQTDPFLPKSPSRNS